VVAQIENPACGDILKLTLKVRNGRIAEIRFLAKGCVAAMACASAITELTHGQTVDNARQLSREAVIQFVGGLPEASIHASHLAVDTLAAAMAAIKTRQDAEAPEECSW
jgi:nitrogen fixation protein NifU and related proteins